MDHKVRSTCPSTTPWPPHRCRHVAERAYGAFRVSNTGGVGYRPFLRATRALGLSRYRSKWTLESRNVWDAFVNEAL